MAKKISASDIFAEEDIFRNIKASVQETIDKFKSLDSIIKVTASKLQGDISGADFGNTKGINSFVAATQQVTKTQKEAVAVTKVLAQAEKDQATATKALIDIEIKKQKLVQEEIRTAQQKAKTEQANTAAIAKTVKAAKDQESAYKRLVISTRDLKSQSQELGAQMLEMERKGLGAGVAYDKLSKQYMEVTNEARKSDEQLKHLDKTVGDNFRNVGNYEGATKGLKQQLREMTQALQNMETTDPRFKQMTIDAGELKDKIQDTNAVIKSTAGSAVENLGTGIAKAGKVGIDAFAGMTGAMGLFGIESEGAMQAMLKLQQLAAMSEALTSLGALGDTVTEVKASFIAAATKLGLFTSAKVADTVVTEAQTVATIEAEIATTGLGKSMLSLPIVALIAGIVALGSALIYFALQSDGVAETIGKNFKAMSKSVQNYNKEIVRTGDLQDKNTERQMENLDREGRRRIANGEDEKKVQADIIKQKMHLLDISIEQDRASVRNLKSEIEKLKVYKVQMETLIFQQIAMARIDYANSLTDIGRTKAREKEVALMEQLKAFEKSNKQDIFDSNKLLYEKTAEIVDAKDKIEELKITQLESNKATKENTKDVKDNKKALEDRNKAIEEEIALQELRAEQEYGRRVSEKEALDAIDLQIERDAEAKKLAEEIADEQKQEDDLAKKRATDEEKRLKRLQTEAEFIKMTTDFFIKNSEKKIAQMDKEIAKAESQYTILQQLAVNGNINAQESLAEQQRIINEANARKEKELKRQQRIKLAESVYSTYNSKVAAGSEHPLMDTIKDTMLLQQFIASLPTFYDGTEDTGKNGNGIDGKGGFHAVLHPNERVIPKSLNEQIGGLSNEALAKMASEYQNGKIIRSNSQIGSAFDTAVLVGKLDELTTAIKQKPETNIGIGEITQSVMEIVKSTKQGNTTTYNRYKVRR